MRAKLKHMALEINEQKCTTRTGDRHRPRTKGRRLFKATQWLFHSFARAFRFLRNRFFQFTLERPLQPPGSGARHLFTALPPALRERLLTTRRLAIMAGHQNAVASWPPYINEYLRQLKAEGYTTVYINACDTLTNSNSNHARSIDFYCVRKNLGADFGSWSDFARLLSSWGMGFNSFDEVLICNDSVVGPIFELSQMFNSLRSTQADVIGLTDSYEVAHHLQSYFLSFSQRSLPFLQRWLSLAPYYRNRLQLITVMEVGLAQQLKNAGLSWAALYPFSKLKTEDIPADEILNLELRLDGTTLGIDRNPTHLFAEVLVAKHSFPFVKRELLLKNPKGMICAGRLMTIIREKGLL